MKTYFVISVLLLFISCAHKSPKVEERNAPSGEFGTSTLLWNPVDYMTTPIGKHVEHHPGEYGFLDEVEVFSIAHQSDGLSVTGFLVAPKADGHYPVIVFNRGGNRENGSLVVATAVQIMAPLAAKGYVVVASNYRGNSGSEGREEFGGADVNDVANLILSAAEFDGADNSRVGLLGVSRGGMMNFLTLKNHPDLNVKAIANVGGVSDFAASITHHPVLEEVCAELIPGYAENREQLLKDRSAIHWVHELPKDVPQLLMHSKTDDHVLYDQVTQLADSLDHHRIPYQLLSFADDTHGLTHHRELVVAKVIDWFDQYVKNDGAFATDESRVVVP